MNPNNSYYHHSFNVQNNREKTNAFMQHNYYNTYQFQENTQLKPMSQTSTNFYNPSVSSNTNFSHTDKYKNFYTEDYRIQNQRTKHQNANNFLKNPFYDEPNQRPNIMTYNSSMGQQALDEKSLDRKRFYTVVSRSKSRQNTHHINNPSNIKLIAPQQHSSNFNQSFIQSQYSSNSFLSSNRQKVDPQRQFNKLADQRFSVSSMDSNSEKLGGNKTEYFEKANKKISLKRDISPKYEMYKDKAIKFYDEDKQRNQRYLDYEQQTHSAIMNKTYENIFSDQSSVRVKSQINVKNNKQLYPSQQYQTHNQQKQPQLQFYYKKSLNNSAIDEMIRERRQEFLKKSPSKKPNSPPNSNFHESKSISSSFLKNQIEKVIPNKDDKEDINYNRKTSRISNNKKNTGSIKNQAQINAASKKTQLGCDNSSTKMVFDNKKITFDNKDKINLADNQKKMSPENNKRISATNSSFPIIDPEVYADMKISRIEQSTLNMEEKINALLKSLQTLSKNNKEQQAEINQINQYISKQEEEGVSAHDIKRIKKQLKILKTNFETAFTSMTEQINRKLLKEQHIMKSLSDQIKLVAEENFKLSESLGEKSIKVQSLQKSVTSFMRENEERMESLVMLNDSFSSAKKSRNHSFQYGLELKNMSGDENSTRQKEMVDNLVKKVDIIEKQIRKMKVFHIEEKQTENQKLSEVSKQIQRIEHQLANKTNKSQIQQIMIELTQPEIIRKIETAQKQSQQLVSGVESKLTIQLTQIKSQIQLLHKTCHEELYEYRLSKLEEIPNNHQIKLNNSPVNNREITEKVNQFQTKQRALFDRIGLVEKKIINLQEKQYHSVKNYDQLKLKELKHSGDIRELQVMTKDFNLQLIQNSKLKSKGQTSWEQSITQIKKLSGILETRVSQMQRLNLIQVQNIESINTEFQRVINKEIIPKFTQVHAITSEIDKKMNSLLPQSSKTPQSTVLGPNITHLIQVQLKTQVQQYFNQNMSRFMQNKVKVISTKLVSSKSPLTKLGLKNFHNPNTPRNENCIYLPTPSANANAAKQDTYLVDEHGWLMDWQGFYLMQLDQYGNRARINISEEEIYFMQVNGLEVKRVNDQ